MAPERRRGRRAYRRWNRGHNGGRVDHAEDTIAGDSVRRVLDTYCPFCATDIRSVGPRRLIRCPNIAICGKILPLDDNCCPSCCNYTRPMDNFCRVCRANLRGVVRGRGGLYQQLRRAPSPINNASPPRQEENAEEEFQDRDTDYGEDDGENGMFVPSGGEEEDDINEEEHQGHQDADVDEPEENEPEVPPNNNPRNEHYLFSRDELRQFGLLADE